MNKFSKYWIEVVKILKFLTTGAPYVNGIYHIFLHYTFISELYI